MKRTNRPCGHALRFLAFLFSFLPGLNFASAQTWPPNAPSLLDIPITAGAAINPEWVNCDMYTYYDGSDPYVLIAVTYDDLTNNTVHVVLYDSKNNNTTGFDISNAKHPDIVLGEYTQCGAVTHTGEATVFVVYEDLNQNSISDQNYSVSGLGTGTLVLTWSTYCGHLLPVTGSKNPHIDLLPNGNISNGCAILAPFIVTYDINNGNGNEVHAIHFGIDEFLASTPTWSNYNDVFIDYGNRPDVAVVTDIAAGLGKAYFVYFDNMLAQIKRAEMSIDYPTYPVTTFANMETGNFVGYPRIEAANLAGSSITPWHAVAEIQGENNSGVRIHGYNNTGSINVIDYGFGVPDEEFSPTVAVANGNATFGIPGDVGNSGYSVGWNVNNNELNALYLVEGNTNTIMAGYDQVNTTGLSITGYGAGKNLFAMTSSSNSGFGLAAAWYDGSDIQLKLAGNSFAFKPTTINLTSRNKLNIHPNPATSQLYVSGVKTANYSVTNITGQQLMQGEINSNTALDISNLTAGVYLLNVLGKDVSEHIKFVKE